MFLIITPYYYSLLLLIHAIVFSDYFRNGKTLLQ